MSKGTILYGVMTNFDILLTLRNKESVGIYHVYWNGLMAGTTFETARGLEITSKVPMISLYYSTTSKINLTLVRITLYNI